MTHLTNRRLSLPFLLVALFIAWLSSVAGFGQIPAGPGTAEKPDRLGRPVRILSLSFREKTREQVLALVDQHAAAGVDLVILPETWLGQGESPESLEGPTITAFGAL